MISLTSSINSESFSNFGQSHGWSGTFPMDLPSVIIFSSMSYDLSTAYMTLCLIVSKGFWKSMKQLYMFFPCLLAFSAINRSVKILCTVLLSFLNPVVSNLKVEFNCKTSLQLKYLVQLK